MVRDEKRRMGRMERMERKFFVFFVLLIILLGRFSTVEAAHTATFLPKKLSDMLPYVVIDTREGCYYAD